ncbi:MAG: hypothetical protein UZ22_OP11002000477 [Microgenomates bacterium OLB23]|nr:MAG: hypothetical protein UZ22_OP11002000477 [Microgenomates bacterium OLB23]
MAFFIFALALVVRLLLVHNGIFFEGELGHNYLAIKNAVLAHKIPLLGPPTSHEWLSFGPLYYWLFGPILAIGGFHPIVGALFFAVVHSVVPVLHIYIAKKLVSYEAAIASSFLLVVSPFLLLISWQSRFFSLVLPLVYVLVYVLLHKRYTEQKKIIACSRYCGFGFLTFTYHRLCSCHLWPMCFLNGGRSF